MRKRYKPITMDNVTPIKRKLEKYPFRSLDVGENFFVFGHHCKGSLNTLANRYKKRNGLVFTINKQVIEQDGEKVPGMLVTRIA